MLYEHITELIGNTPLLRIDRRVHGLQHIELYAKLEYFNPFGSLKDRIAYGMLKDVLAEAQHGHKTIVESSSGNTAKALCALCAIYDLPFKTVTNRIRNREVRMILHILGAQIEELPCVSEYPDPFDPNDFLVVAKSLVQAEPEKYYLTDQCFNPKNPQAHYQGTGKELLDDLGSVDYFFTFLGTCGSSFGIGSYLKERNSQTKVFGVASSPGNIIPGGRSMNELWEVGFFLGWQTESERDRIEKEKVLKLHQAGGEEWQERRPAPRRPNRSRSTPSRPRAGPVAARCVWGITVTEP